MAHTHLVKGLDYAMLHKVRSEMQQQELERKLQKEKRELEALKAEVFK